MISFIQGSRVGASPLGLALIMGLLMGCASPTPTLQESTVSEEEVATLEAFKPTGPLIVYSGRSESLVGAIIQQFSDATGIKVSVKYANTPQLVATLLEEGERTPADIFFAQDPGGLGAVEGILRSLPDGILSRVPIWARSPRSTWVGISGRARVVVYNTDKLIKADLPDDIFGFIDPKWRGRIGWPPTNASFQSMVTAMRMLWGEEKTRQWLQGILANDPKVYPKNTPIVAAVATGEIDVGFVNHYYLYRFLAEEGESFAARNYHPRAGGPGNLMMVAGVGMLATSKNSDAAEKFMEFMLSNVGQAYFVNKTHEYPMIEGVRTQRLLAPPSQINIPQIDMADLGDLQGTQKLLREMEVLP